MSRFFIDSNCGYIALGPLTLSWTNTEKIDYGFQPKGDIAYGWFHIRWNGDVLFPSRIQYSV